MKNPWFNHIYLKLIQRNLNTEIVQRDDVLVLCVSVEEFFIVTLKYACKWCKGMQRVVSNSSIIAWGYSQSCKQCDNTCICLDDNTAVYLPFNFKTLPCIEILLKCQVLC